MNIDVYEPIKVKWDYDVTYAQPEDSDIVVYLGDVEVHRKRGVRSPSYYDDDSYAEREKDRAVGEFAKKLLHGMSNAGMLDVIG